MAAIIDKTTYCLYSGSRSRIQEVDALRGFGIFLVVLGHAIILFPINLHENVYCNAIFNWLTSVHMPLLFMVSGYCYTHRDYKSHIHKKFQRLVIPYLVFNLADMLPRQLLSQLVRRPRPMWDSVVKFLFYGGEYWFIYTLFIIFVIYPFLYKFMKSDVLKMVMLEVILFMLALSGVGVKIFNISSVIYYMFYFHAGVMLRTIFAGKWPIARNNVVFLLLMFMLWFMLLYLEGL